MDDEETIERLNAKWFSNAIYTFRQYYEAVPKSQRREVIDFDWDVLIPDEAIQSKERFNSELDLKMYDWIKAKRYFRIWLFFARKRTYKKLREIKRKTLK